MNRSLINNAVTGVSKGHEKTLELSGVGFRANIKGENLNLQIGFSHDVNFKIPKDIKIKKIVAYVSKEHVFSTKVGSLIL